MSQYYCPQCGTALEDGAAFCSNCNAKIVAKSVRDQAAVSGPFLTPEDHFNESNNLPPAHTLTKATFGLRLIAYIIDFFILTAIQLVVSAIAPDMALTANVVVTAAYFIFFIGRDGQTYGKKFLGLKVVTADGNVPGYGKAFIRYLGYFLSSLILGIGYLLILWDKQSQALHDKLAATYVIKVARNG